VERGGGRGGSEVERGEDHVEFFFEGGKVKDNRKEHGK